MKRTPEEWPYINPKAYYPIGEAAMLVAVSRTTLRKDVTELKVIPYIRSEKTGRMKLLGKNLIHYREHIR